MSINLKVLYEDNHVIAVFKPAGVLSQKDVTDDKSMVDYVKSYIKEKYKKPGNVFLGVVHRLDRPACGILLFAKTSKGASRLSEQFRNQQIEKTYQVLVSGKPVQSKGVLINRLIKDEKLKKSREHADGQETKLYYEVLKTGKEYTLLLIKIGSGKFHQIRSQLALAGWPIVGDVKYLPAGRQVREKWDNKKAIALCATDISFRMATEDKVITLHIDIPVEWKKYIDN